MKLEGKTALVTGAGSGIGRAIAELFASEGARVMVSDIREDTGNETVRRIQAGGGTASFVLTDVSQEEQVAAAVRRTVETYGRLDIMINNAGTGGPDWERVTGINLDGVYFGCKYAVEAMGDGGGVIVNTASMAGVIAGYGQAYVATKHGVIGLTRQVALENAKNNIRANCLCPGWILTGLTEGAYQNEAVRGDTESRIPMGRWGSPEEVAKSALFLACDDSSYITGVPLLIDGGFTLQ